MNIKLRYIIFKFLISLTLVFNQFKIADANELQSAEKVVYIDKVIKNIEMAAEKSENLTTFIEKIDIHDKARVFLKKKIAENKLEKTKLLKFNFSKSNNIVSFKIKNMTLL